MQREKERERDRDNMGDGERDGRRKKKYGVKKKRGVRESSMWGVEEGERELI